MAIQDVLNRLNKVRKTGANSWIASCPHHEDRSPSLTLSEPEPGKILIHCFAGCPPNDVLASIGITFDDLFPERLKNSKRKRIPVNPYDALRAVSSEILVARIITARWAAGEPMTEAERQRLGQAASRIAAAEDVIHGR